MTVLETLQCNQVDWMEHVLWTLNYQVNHHTHGGIYSIGSLTYSYLGTAQSGAMILDQNGNSSRSYTLGRVLVNYNGRWGTICRKESFGNTEADVICHQLAFSGASIWRYAAEDKWVMVHVYAWTLFGISVWQWYRALISVHILQCV